LQFQGVENRAWTSFAYPVRDLIYYAEEEAMSTFWGVATSLLYTAAFIGCLWWANWAYRQLDLGRRYNLAAGVRLLIVLAVGAMMYSAVARILNGIFAIFRQYGEGWGNAADVIGGLAVLAFVAWLYTRATLEK
jgi:hypothetical protein